MSDEDAALARDAVRTAQPVPEPTDPDGEIDDDSDADRRDGEDDDGAHPQAGIV
jgi:hypothetical protein